MSIEVSAARTMSNKVPAVTIYFWVIKVLCTTVGESAADFLNVNLNLGLSVVSAISGVVLIVLLGFQFRADRYRVGRYWASVAVISVFGTLVTDNLTDNLGVPLEASTVIFSVLLAVTFVAWYRSEGTLSIHSIVTTRRETFYWVAILFTFALGTATGDLMAEVLGLGYLTTGIIVGALIAIVVLAWKWGIHPVLAFWFIYVLTRPLGASIGDYLSQPSGAGGLGLGTTVTSLVFVAGIVATVVYLAVSKADVTSASLDREKWGGQERHGLRQTVILVGVVLVVGGIGYGLRTSTLQSDTASTAVPGGPGVASAGGAAATKSPLGDLTTFRTITQDTSNLLKAHNQSGATSRVDDLETQWDQSEARLKSRDENDWTNIDGKIDTVLRELRSTDPQVGREQAALHDLLAALH